jgi:hypothetical protein
MAKEKQVFGVDAGPGPVLPPHLDERWDAQHVPGLDHADGGDAALGRPRHRLGVSLSTADIMPRTEARSSASGGRVRDPAPPSCGVCSAPPRTSSAADAGVRPSATSAHSASSWATSAAV